MITKNAMQLKAFIKNKAVEKNISAQLVMQNYMLERLLERISLSDYRNNFILKGGFLISAIVGLDTRTTMDLDTTIKGFDLNKENLKKIFTDVCAIPVEDDVSFQICNMGEIREGDEYPGYRVHLKASYPPLSVPLTVDVTTGDKITPREISYTFKLLFDDRSISVLAYNLETVIAEKLETVISRGIANTRPRDFYDIHILYTLRGSECNMEILSQALRQTADKRGSFGVMKNYEKITLNVLSSEQMQGFWTKYRKDFDYASDITFEDVCKTVITIFKQLSL
ncbi:MAG: nucleotidyl transferase AbiEii/AbiGii toxin family protein [Oscillospiraceae bacterium]|nr:nucleotidyl transferase AbiEii/AbiGii toxin family protein [Oscillospiraceae bacterium]